MFVMYQNGKIFLIKEKRAWILVCNDKNMRKYKKIIWIDT